MQIRQAEPADAEGMNDVLTPILEDWGSARPRGPDHVLAHYIAHPDALACHVAVEEDGTILGFQALKRAVAGNVYDLPEGWGIIGTYVARGTGRRGIGRALFAASERQARAAGLEKIDATIGGDNAEGQAYYEAMGFRTWRTTETAVCKCLDLGGP